MNPVLVSWCPSTWVPRWIGELVDVVGVYLSLGLMCAVGLVESWWEGWWCSKVFSVMVLRCGRGGGGCSPFVRLPFGHVPDWCDYGSLERFLVMLW